MRLKISIGSTSVTRISVNGIIEKNKSFKQKYIDDHYYVNAFAGLEQVYVMSNIFRSNLCALFCALWWVKKFDLF